MIEGDDGDVERFRALVLNLGACVKAYRTVS